MKTVAVTNRSREMRKLLELAKKQDVVVRTSDGDEFVLSLIDDFDVELALQRKNKKLMAFLDKRLREGRRQEGIPLDEVKRRLGLNSDGEKISRRQAGPHPR